MAGSSHLSAKTQGHDLEVQRLRRLCLDLLLRRFQSLWMYGILSCGVRFHRLSLRLSLPLFVPKRQCSMVEMTSVFSVLLGSTADTCIVSVYRAEFHTL